MNVRDKVCTNGDIVASYRVPVNIVVANKFPSHYTQEVQPFFVNILIPRVIINNLLVL